jgi:hypothetical protein
MLEEKCTPATEVHHATPRCLLKLHDRTNGVLPDPDLAPAWLEWQQECERWRVPVEISRDDLQELVERSTVALDREKHRLIHESDFVRWGRRGGLETLRRYGRGYFALLGRRRWGRISPEELAAFRVEEAA